MNAPSGLCATCQHHRDITSDRGSVFILCQLGLTRPAEFPKYPRLPVLECAGYLRADRATGEPDRQ